MKFIDIHTHNQSKQNSVTTILNCYPNSKDFSTLFSIGIHPWHINDKETTKELLFIEEKLQLSNCLAIGECGLDKLIDVDFEYQIKVFKKQIKLSEQYKKPLIIHCVKAYQEIICLKKELKPKQPWIIHGFNKNYQTALSLIKNEIFLSFGKSLMVSSKLQEVFFQIPLQKVFFETDTTIINVEEVYKKGAIIKSLEINKIKEVIYQNFNNIFIK